MESKATRLAEECFQPTKKKRSMDWAPIASTASSPSWFSPSAQNVNSPFGDIQVIGELAQHLAVFLFFSIADMMVVWFS